VFGSPRNGHEKGRGVSMAQTNKKGEAMKVKTNVKAGIIAVLIG
jgi:hypothetical protein